MAEYKRLNIKVSEEDHEYLTEISELLDLKIGTVMLNLLFKLKRKSIYKYIKTVPKTVRQNDFVGINIAVLADPEIDTILKPHSKIKSAEILISKLRAGQIKLMEVVK